MTLSDLLSLATATLTTTTVDERAAQGLALARGFMDRLGAAQECGWEEPDTAGGQLDIPEQWTTFMIRSLVDPDVADIFARMLLAAADTARQGDES